MDIDKELRKIARALLKRNPLRRGPYIITDEYLKQFLRRTGKTAKRV